MLLKILVYAYICNEYSSRRIEQLIKRDIQFMWLAGMSKPDHNTINRYNAPYHLLFIIGLVIRLFVGMRQFNAEA